MNKIIMTFVCGLLISGFVQASEWTINQVIEVKAMCYQVSEEELLEAKLYRDSDVANMIELITSKVGGEKNYMSFADIYCACKARALSKLYTYEEYMLDTYLTEKKFLETKENKTCLIGSLSKMNVFNQDVETNQPYVMKKWDIQLASYKNKNNAEALANKIIDAGYEVSVIEANNNFRVVIGVFNSRKEAESAQEALKNQFRLSGIVIWHSD